MGLSKRYDTTLSCSLVQNRWYHAERTIMTLCEE